MYCRKCGKQIDYDAEFCHECSEVEAHFGAEAPKANEPQQAQTAQQTPYSQMPPAWQAQAQFQQQAQAQKGSVMTGFGKALASTIMSYIGFIFSFLAFGGFAEAIDYGDESMLGASVVLFMITLGLCIPALIMGIQSIKTFSRAKKNGEKKPVPALVLGICGVVFSGFGLLIVLLTSWLFLMLI